MGKNTARNDRRLTGPSCCWTRCFCCWLEAHEKALPKMSGGGVAGSDEGVVSDIMRDAGVCEAMVRRDQRQLPPLLPPSFVDLKTTNCVPFAYLPPYPYTRATCCRQWTQCPSLYSGAASRTRSWATSVSTHPSMRPRSALKSWVL